MDLNRRLAIAFFFLRTFCVHFMPKRAFFEGWRNYNNTHKAQQKALYDNTRNNHPRPPSPPSIKKRP